MDIFLLLFLLIIIVGTIISYIYFMREKKAQLLAIEQGICPKCHQPTMDIVDQRGGGCSGTKMVTFECKNCKYSSVFNIGGGSCGSGGCRL
jgi:RNase P subunit RPR2